MENSDQSNEESKSSYDEILRSSSIMGGAAGLGMLLGVIRLKFSAVLIGVVGVGILANFTAIINLVGSLANLGIQESAVRSMVNAIAKQDDDALGLEAVTIDRLGFLSGFLGLVVMWILSPMLSRWTFNNEEYSHHIAALGLTILLGNISGAKLAIIQGARRISDLAKINALTDTALTVITALFYLWLGQNGIVPVLITISILRCALTFHYSRKIAVPKSSAKWRDVFTNARTLMQLGLAFMWSTAITALVFYLIRVVLTSNLNVAAVGMYSAAYVLSGLFINFVLQAMGTDFYPRLTSAAHDNKLQNTYIKQQQEIGLLIVTPGVLATLTFSYVLVQLFYSKDFLPSVDLLQWLIFGGAVRVISWPLGFVLRARAEFRLFVFTETIFHGLHLLFVIVGLKLWGIEGAAIGFFVMNLVVLVIVYFVVKSLIDFKWDTESFRVMFVCYGAITLTFLLTKTLPVWMGSLSGVFVSILIGLWCLKAAVNKLGAGHSWVILIKKLPGTKWLLV